MKGSLVKISFKYLRIYAEYEPYVLEIIIEYGSNAQMNFAYDGHTNVLLQKRKWVLGRSEDV